jgi:hypothetical protein
MKKRPHKRRTYLIKKGMQLKATGRVTFIAIFFSLFVVFEVYITIWPVVSGFLPKDMMSLVQQRIFFRAIFFLLPFIFVIATSSILLSHRIAGPLYRIELTLDKLIQGEDVEYIHLRKNDELKELAEKINRLIPIIKKSKETPIK